MHTINLVLNCGNREYCIELAEYILKYRGIKADQIVYRVNNGSLILRITGSKVEITNTKRIIMKAYREWRQLKAWYRGSKAIDVTLLMKLIRKPFIIDALIEVLKILGYEVKLDSNKLFTNAPQDLVMNVASGLASKLEELVKYKPKASYTAKALVTAYAYLIDKDVNSVIKELEARKALMVESYKVLVKKEWRSLLRKLLIESEGVMVGTRDKEENR